MWKKQKLGNKKIGKSDYKEKIEHLHTLIRNIIYSFRSDTFIFKDHVLFLWNHNFLLILNFRVKNQLYLCTLRF